VVNGQTLLLSGVPRAGTSLACRLLDQATDTVALSEPFRLADFEARDSTDGALEHIESSIAEVRHGILTDSEAPSTHVGGALHDARVTESASGSELRRPQGEQGVIRLDRPLSPRFRLVIKHNALFAALLPQLCRRYHCVALVRNPLPVLASWQTVDLPVNAGRLPAGELYDRSLHSSLAAEQDRLQRQLAILDWFFSAFRPLQADGRVVRYEDLVASNGGALYAACDIEHSPTETLGSRNDSGLYDTAGVPALLDALLARDGQWLELYTRADLKAAADALEADA
jgi:hypothetical protein